MQERCKIGCSLSTCSGLLMRSWPKTVSCTGTPRTDCGGAGSRTEVSPMVWRVWEQRKASGENTRQCRLDSNVLGAFMFDMEHGCPCGLLTEQQTKHVWGTLRSATGSRIVSWALTLLCWRARVTHALRSALDAAPSMDPE